MKEVGGNRETNVELIVGSSVYRKTNSKSQRRLRKKKE